MKIKTVCVFCFSILALVPSAFAGKTELTTYYPSAYGEYVNLKSTTDSYFATASGNVGIGTTNPRGKLDVAGTGGINWGISHGEGLLTVGDFGTVGGSLFVNTPSINASYPSGFGVDGSYTNPGGIGTSIINLKAYPVYSGGGYDSALAFYTGLGTTMLEKMRITSAGNVGIGTTGPNARLQVFGGGSGAAPATSGAVDATMNFRAGRGGVSVDVGMMDTGVGYIQNRNIADFSSNYDLSLQPNGGAVGIGGIPQAGWRLNVVGLGATSATYAVVVRKAGNAVNNFYLRDDGFGYLNWAAWSYSSDRRLKENISYIQSGLNIIERLKPAKFDFIKGGKRQAGFIAQEVQEVLPDIVTQNPGGMLSMQTESIIPYLVKATQEQQAEIELLKKEIAELKKK